MIIELTRHFKVYWFQKIPVSSTSLDYSNRVSNNSRQFNNFNNSPTTNMIVLDKVHHNQ